MKLANLIVAGLMLGGGALSAQAQILKCVGKDGRVEFAQNCPPGTKLQETGVGSRPAPATAPAAAATDGKSDAKADGKGAPKSLADRDAEFRKRQTEQKAAEEKSAKARSDEAERQRICQAAQGQLVALRNRQRIYGTNPKTGELVAFEDADYQREQAIAERVAAESCKI